MLDILAAITKSASRNSKNFPRTVRARVVHPTVARTIVIPKYTSTDDQSCGNAVYEKGKLIEKKDFKPPNDLIRLLHKVLTISEWEDTYDNLVPV